MIYTPELYVDLHKVKKPHPVTIDLIQTHDDKLIFQLRRAELEQYDAKQQDDIVAYIYDLMSIVKRHGVETGSLAI